ncbi:MAG: sigma-70 family RNA polymerase sigma factor [Pyrinomonadaceae bacterium]|nr:sigma-70 family RNA polymerase sigma factor [Pyrinomonadaceae bacterium]MCX7640841.1 sigma-70 family RNA polymerase sigma factor [Pyrinomonadaceae bacterium]MDW8303394.1 sigma-70 family RNA polymerase sigma factor [Acidobacteriota bacterium]
MASILERIARKDASAVEECVETYGGLVWALAQKMCANRQEAEDAVQEIFIDIWKNAYKFDRNKSSEATFIVMIARRRLIDRLRKLSRKPQIESIESASLGLSQSYKQIQHDAEVKQVIEAFNQLKPEQRQILRLLICEGFSHQEVSTITGIPLGTVKSHARRGLIKIREILGIKNSSKGETP